ncbi:4F5 protein family domain-containing protein [Ditylenchus destructor]|nr:4F5 protein family domain-containing protein [Ditylenchus destructor]
MARGHQKAVQQQKNQKRQDDAKKQGSDQKKAALKALTLKCSVCFTLLGDPKTYKQHFESKHPKSPMPPELVDVQA